MRPSSLFFRLITLLSSGLLVGAAVWSIRLGWADHLRQQPDLASVTRSTEIDPLNAQGYRARAIYEELAGVDSSASWRKAAEADPRDPRILIPAGIQAELRGDIKTAEQYLRSAERFGKLWLPRWTLANFYARRGDRGQMLFWLHAALERSYGETTAAFQLALDSGITEEEIATRILPPEIHPYGQFLVFLSQRATNGSISALLEKLAGRYMELSLEVPVARRSRVPLMKALNRLLADGEGSPARRLWNLGCEKGLIASTATAGPSPITNGSFSHVFLSDALDWSLGHREQVLSQHHPGPGTVKFSFSGQQEGTFVLLSQTVVLPKDQGWKVSFDFKTQNISARQAAFGWTLADEPLPVNGALASDSWATGRFVIPPGPARVARLALVASRPVGATRPEGDLWIRNIRADPVP